MRHLILVPLAAAVLAVAGCGDDSSDTAATPPAPSTEAASAPPAGGDATVVGMKGLKFTEDDIAVKVGSTVTFKNNEDIPHNVVAEEGADFESDTFGKDGTYDYKAEKAGVVKYVCTIHPGMDGTVTVEE